MATYGRGQMLGSGINPESFKQDYSGFARAAEMQAQGMSNLGASIGGVIKDFGDEKKKINQDIAKGKSALEFAKANYPELASRIDEIGKIFSDVNVSKADQAAAGSQMGEFVTAMIRGQEFNTEVELKKRALEIQEAEAFARNAPSPRSVNLQLGEIREVINGNPYDVKVTFDPATGETRRLDGSVVSAGFRDSAAIDAGLNLSFPQFENVLDGSLLPPIDPNDIAAAVELTGGQSDVSNVSPMQMGTPTTTQTLLVDGLPFSQAGAETIPPGATPIVSEEEQARFLTSEEKQKFGLNVNNPFAAKFQGETMISIPEIIKEGQLPSKFRPATPEESKKFEGIKGQIDESTGRFYPVQESSPELKVKLLKKAAEFYSQGNKSEALIYATAAGIGGLFGNLTIPDLDQYFSNPPSDKISNPPSDKISNPLLDKINRPSLDKIFGTEE